MKNDIEPVAQPVEFGVKIWRKVGDGISFFLCVLRLSTGITRDTSQFWIGGGRDVG